MIQDLNRKTHMFRKGPVPGTGKRHMPSWRNCSCNKGYISRVIGIEHDCDDNHMFIYNLNRKDRNLLNLLKGSYYGQRIGKSDFRRTKKSWKSHTKNKKQWAVHKKYCKTCKTGRDYAYDALAEDERLVIELNRRAVSSDLCKNIDALECDL